MFFFGVLGAVLFFVASGYIIAISRKDDVIGVWRLLLAIVFSFATALLFLLDVTLIFLYGY